MEPKISAWAWVGMYIKPEKYDTPEQVANLVCAVYNLKREQLNGHNRTTIVREARQVAMYLIRKRFEKKITLNEIGEMFGGFDHSTVTNAIQKIALDIKYNDRYRIRIQELEERMKYPNNPMKFKAA